MKKFRTVLLDDEPLALTRLQRLLTRHAASFEVVGLGRNGREGLELLATLSPDLIFLDVDMPELNGFEMLARLENPPLVVFVTAFDEYAVRAFEENSIDYLMKPVEAERLEKTLEKLKKWQAPAPEPFNNEMLALLEHMKPKKEIFSLSVRVGERILLVPLAEIGYFEAEDKYVFLHTLDGQRYLTGHTLAALEEKLPGHFTRISRSAIVNTLKIKELRRHFNSRYIVTLLDRKATQLQTSGGYGDKLRGSLEF